MGLILGPVIIFWMVSFFYSWRMGYIIFIDKPFFPYIVSVILIAIIVALIYVFIGLFTFKDHRELAMFEIPWVFLLNKHSFLIFVSSMLIYFFGGNIFNGDIPKTIIFILAFSISLGSLVGCFSASAFMQKYNISETH
ncbi:hypothetical protein ABT56_11000 [Photobacterium aquae]|uniref:Uncharacterized protein n=1 Tax=Photobacterium aquae TaxID=1195763 RepID=A0A0J1H104_9GAMM|nr:hypothetical protein [Photobacterium aquae]KLV05496.1 hypothetical protein ABT56_11000 [Photobacterium aquae]